MRFHPLASRFPAVAGVAPMLGFVVATTNYEETLPLIWAITIISVIGAAMTFGALIWAVIRFRDPSTKGRRYG